MTTTEERARAIRLALFDVDGVLTDGRLFYGPAGEAMKVFNILDGHGLRMLAKSGVATGLLSGRRSEAARVAAEADRDDSRRRMARAASRLEEALRRLDEAGATEGP